MKKRTTKKSSSEAKTPAALPSASTFVDACRKDRKLAGKVRVELAANTRNPYSLRRPTGLVGLDIELGGGFPAGGIIEVFGADSSGKSTLLHHTLGENQRIHGKDSRIFVYKTEERPDKGHGRLNGFCVAYSEQEIKEFAQIRHDAGLPEFTAEELDDLRFEIGEVVYEVAGNAEYGLEVVLRALEWGHFQIVAIDSVGSLLTTAADDGDLTDVQVSGSARLITKFIDKVSVLYNNDRPDGSMLETTLIGVDQVRAAIGASKYEPDKKPALGAWAWKHAQLISLGLSKGKKLRDADGELIGHTVNWETRKGKVGSHDGKRGVYSYFHTPRMSPVFWRDVQETFLGGYGIFEEMTEAAKRLGVVTVAGSWVSCAAPEIRVQGTQAFAQHLALNGADAEALKAACYRAANLSVRFR